MALKTKIDLNDQLEHQLQQYFKAHPDKSLSALVQETLETRLSQENTAAGLLSITGITQNTPFTDESNREILS